MGTESKTLYTVLSVCVGVSGTILNFLVCFVHIRAKHPLDAANIFIFNISCGALLSSITALPLLVASNVREEWLFGEAGCIAYGFLTGFFSLGSMVHIAGAAYERYFTFEKMLNYGGGKLSRGTAIRYSVAIWCYVLFWSSLPLLGWSSYVQEGIGTSCAINWKSNQANDVSYLLCLMFACFVVPVSVITICHIKSYKTARRLTELVKQNWGENARIVRQTVQAERSTAKIIVLVSAGFLVGWTPYVVSSLVSMFEPELISGHVASIPAYMAKAWVCYNAIIHLIFYKDLRLKVKALFFCVSKRKQKIHPIENATYQLSHRDYESNNEKVAVAENDPNYGHQEVISLHVPTPFDTTCV